MAALHTFLQEQRDAILQSCTRKIIASSPAAQASKDELTHDLPRYYDDLVHALERAAGLPAESPLPKHSPAAVEHGRQRYRCGFDLRAVVNDYGALCESITEAAEARHQRIEISEYRALNQSLDAGIAEAVEQFAAERQSASESERCAQLGFIVHELRNTLSNARVSFALIKDGKVPAYGRTAQIAERSLAWLSELISSLLVNVRLGARALKRQRFPLRTALDETAAAASLEARARGIELAIEVQPELQVEADRQVLATAISNLLQNAIKFSRPGGRVALRAYALTRELRIEVEDACGGLPDGKVEELFAPFVQKSGDRSGLGLGLAIVREAVEAHHGALRVRNLPGKGCVFTIVL